MKKIFGFIVSLIMIFSTVGCMDNNPNSLPINPDSSNSATNTDEDSEENNDSSSNGNDNKPSDETDGWTGIL